MKYSRLYSPGGTSIKILTNSPHAGSILCPRIPEKKIKKNPKNIMLPMPYQEQSCLLKSYFIKHPTVIME